MEAKVKIRIKGVDKLEGLLENHRRLIKELEHNLDGIHACRLEVEAEINRPASEPPADLTSDVE